MALLTGKHIFVVEDNTGNLTVTSIYLQRDGAIVRFERWMDNTIQMIQDAMPIDLILMDLMLPKTNGFEVSANIRNIPALKDIPIVILSAADPDETIPIAQSKGLNGFIPKPVNPQISEYVAEVLEGKSVWLTRSSF